MTGISTENPQQSTNTLLRVVGVTKRFAGVAAVDQVSLDIKKGEMLALAGENGAGKSTIIRILAGIYQPDEGEMTFQGSVYAPQSPRAAINAGIRVVHQEFNLLESMSVAENILFEKLPRNKIGFLNIRSLYAQAEALLARVGLQRISPRTPIARLGIAERQLVEIARALSTNGKLLILDEPTATLTPKESGVLFEQINLLRAEGMSVLFVSHHLDEIFAHCDRVSIMRNGRYVTTLRTDETDPKSLVGHMIGRKLADQAPIETSPREQVALNVRGLRVSGSPEGPGIDFSLRYGEILGLGGLVGSGRTEILRALFGVDQPLSGEILLDGKSIVLTGPKDAVRHGICLLPESRKEQGLVLAMSAQINLTLARINRVSRAGILDARAERDAFAEMRKALSIRLNDPRQPVAQLSGGNQQKIVLGKWLFGGDARILLLDEPTRGIDVGAKAEIYALLGELAANGCAILVVSSEIPELMHLCSRIMVLSAGIIAGTMKRPEFNEERFLSLAYSQFMQSN